MRSFEIVDQPQNGKHGPSKSFMKIHSFVCHVCIREKKKRKREKSYNIPHDSPAAACAPLTSTSSISRSFLRVADSNRITLLRSADEDRNQASSLIVISGCAIFNTRVTFNVFTADCTIFLVLGLGQRALDSSQLVLQRDHIDIQRRRLAMLNQFRLCENTREGKGERSTKGWMESIQLNVDQS